MYALKIGWKTYLFVNAVEAAQVVNSLERATPVDTLYDGTDHKVMYHVAKPDISIEHIGAVDVYPDHDSLQRYIDERLTVLQQRERDQDALERATAPKTTPPVDAFDGS